MMRRPVQGSVFHGRDAVWPPKCTPGMKDVTRQRVFEGKGIFLGERNSVYPGRNTDFRLRNSVPQERNAFWPAKPVTVWNIRKAGKKSGFSSKLYRKAKQIRAFETPRLPDLELQKVLKSSRFYAKIFRAPSAPYNTTSYLIRAKASGGKAPVVCPSPASPVVISTPILSPSCYREGLSDEVHKEWGVNGYGSMKGLIRLRSTKVETENNDSENDSDLTSPTQSVQQLEKKMDQDISRFEMIYFPVSSSIDSPHPLETPGDACDSHFTDLLEENHMLKDHLSMMKQELNDLRRRIQELEGGIASGADAEVLSEISIVDT